MKELELHNQDKQEVVAEKPIEKQQVLIGKMFPKPGQKLFELNLETWTVSECQYEQTNVDFIAAAQGNVKPKRKLIVKQNHDYDLFLNKANAIRKFSVKYNRTDIK